MPALPVEFHPQALEETIRARRWYAQRSPAAALRMLEDLDLAIHEISEHPNRWPEHLHHTRRVRLRRFPFLIVYRVFDNRIQVVACQHGHQRPGYWHARL